MRAVFVEVGGHVIDETIMLVGDALARFYGGEFYGNEVKPRLEEIAAVRSMMPLDSDAMRRLG